MNSGLICRAEGIDAEGTDDKFGLLLRDLESSNLGFLVLLEPLLILTLVTGWQACMLANRSASTRQAS